jgi:hypothetical protein
MLVDEERATSLSALQLINQPPGSRREVVSFGRRFRWRNRSTMHQEAPQGGWAGSDASDLPAGFARRARGLPSGRFQPQHADREPFEQGLGWSAATPGRTTTGRPALQVCRLPKIES